MEDISEEQKQDHVQNRFCSMLMVVVILLCVACMAISLKYEAHPFFHIEVFGILIALSVCMLLLTLFPDAGGWT
jgi:cell division protein FtsW (lipid II flippase)